MGIATKNVRVVAALGILLIVCALLSIVSAKPAEAAFPGENGKIAFQSNRAGNNIHTIDPTGGTATNLTPSYGGSDPAFSPDGSRLAFVADNEIWVMNAKDGSGRMQLTNNSYSETDPAWSPDGSKIAFESSRRDLGDTDQNIYVMNANDGSGQTNITPNSPTGCSPNCYQGHDTDPAWLPDGSKIAYVHGYGPPTNPFAGGGAPNIWTMDPNGDNHTNVSKNPDTSVTEPALSPDGSKIAYVQTVKGSTDRNIAVMNADGSGQEAPPIDTNTAYDDKPDWGVVAPEDTTAPTGSVLINNGKAKTKKLAVTLNLTATDNPGGSGVKEMSFSKDGKTWLAWEPFASTKSWKLTKGGSATKTVYVKFRDNAGNESAAYKDTIKYAP